MEHHQPGLEVAPDHANPNYPGLEVVPGQYNAGPYAGQSPVPVAGQGPVPVQQYQDKQPSPSLPPYPPSAAPQKSPKRLRWIIVGVVVAAIVIIAAVLGGVLGSRSHNSGGDDEPAANETLKSILPNSKIAVTGYRGNGDFHIRLFYQGPDNALRYSDFWSGTGSWSSPVTLTDLAPMARTPIAAGTYLGVSPPRTDLYYLDEASLLRGQRFRDGVTPAKGLSGDINRFPLAVDRSSRLSAYHPHLVSQDSNGKIRWIHWMEGGKWDNRTFDDSTVTGSSGSGLAVVPASVKFLESGAFMFRGTGGRIKAYVGSTNGSIHDDWAWSSGTPDAQIPGNSALGAFSYARTDNLVNTYALYQDDDGVLQVTFQNEDTPWKGPRTYPALAGADKGTDIACLSQAAWDATSVNVSDSTDMNRCYFQSGKKLKEVRFDGSEWKDLGTIPMP